MPRSGSRRDSRQRAIAYARAHLERTTHPRLLLSLVVTVAALVGFFTSFALLELGLHAMGWRYGIAALVGYATFLFGLRLWLSREGRPGPDLTSGLDLLSGLAPPPFDTPPAEAPLPPIPFGGGGGFSGAGAGGGLGGPLPTGGMPAAADSGSAAKTVAGVVADAGSGSDEGAVILIPILFTTTILVGLVGVVVVLVGAPNLLAEMLALALMLVVTGLVAQRLVPSADSIGDFFRSRPR